MNIFTSIKNKKALTLVELLLYLALVGVMTLVLASFLDAIRHTNMRTRAISEVNQQGTQVLQIMTQTIRESTAIVSPIKGGNATSASITTRTVANNPTLFTLTAGKITMKEGTAAAIDLTSSNVVVTSLTFTNAGSAVDSIVIDMTIQYKNISGAKELNYSENFNATTTLR